jgi:hypothetical protein
MLPYFLEVECMPMYEFRYAQDYNLIVLGVPYRTADCHSESVLYKSSRILYCSILRLYLCNLLSS